MTTRALCVLGVLVVAAELPHPPAARAQEAGSLGQNALAGSWVFGSKGCVRCHAINGVGGRVGPDLARARRVRSYYDLAADMWNHFPRMVERMRELGIEPPRLNPREMGDLIAFLATVNYFAPPGDPARGRRLFSGKGCVRCHQIAGRGGAVGPSLDFVSLVGSPYQVAAAMWNHGPAMRRIMDSLGIVRPTFTAAELTDLIEYLRSASPGIPPGPVYILPGRADLGRRWFVEKNCVACHSIAGRGGRVGPDLAARRRDVSVLGFAAAMWNKAPAMTRAMRARGIQVPELDAAQLADLAAYLYSVAYFRDTPTAAAGRAVVERKACLQCHSLEGRGGDRAGDLARAKGMDTPAALFAAMWNHGRVAASQRRAPGTWPRLRADEMSALATFFLSPAAEP
ncbi:MAG TPA: c-type cytochrome [Gemmatimonadales bacterium]|nr:c-type cytochrome [Gemmatimonadales bacterium]